MGVICSGGKVICVASYEKVRVDLNPNVEVEKSSSSQRPGKEVSTSSQKKRVRSGGNVPPVPILRQIRALHMEFIFAEPGKCNLHLVREFYANWASDARSHFVTVQGLDVPFTPTIINDIVGTSQDTDPLVLIGLNIPPPYSTIQHTLCGPQSMVQWTKHNGKRYHQSLPYAHMLRKARVWLKIVMNWLIPGLYYTDITWDRVCLVYPLMTPTELTIGAVLKSAMRKARVHKGHMYAFGGLVTRLCRSAERHRRDALLMARMYGVEMLRHQNGCLVSTDMQLGDVEMRYPLNAHAKALLGIGPAFRESVDDDISTDEERLRTSSDVESDSDEEVDPAHAGDEAEGGDAMED
ncbi:hypothetical protein KY290_005520 [Solanum tuberosum]|uniref:Putative plant transposon protein domain-containing protein n=1 Tax=Solanum tuberosum TaxID=4113 RepID=A0ABQ7WED9_SOLTU|nr:hypothetical protein KY289_005907 [Solanum tuberosum]KAH0779093.1 hypothetical protein KY290_005520 [Solanum tuberosum]